MTKAPNHFIKCIGAMLVLVSVVMAGCLTGSWHIYDGVRSVIIYTPINGTLVQNNTDGAFSALVGIIQSEYPDFGMVASDASARHIAGKRIGISHSSDYFITDIRITDSNINMTTKYGRDNSISVPRDKDFNATTRQAYEADKNMTANHNGLISSFIFRCYQVHLQSDNYSMIEKRMNA